MFYINNDLDTQNRFDITKFLDFNPDNFDVLTSFLLTNIPRLQEQGTYKVTSEEHRPELLAYNIYKTANSVQYWWILLWYNSILSINDLKTGTIISYPSINSLENLYIRASTLQKSI